MRTLLLLLVVLHAGRASARPACEAGASHGIVFIGETEGIHFDTSRGFGAHVEVFWSDALSTRAAATFVNPAVFTPDVDLGTMGLDIWSATARWHLAPRARFSGFAGAGGALVVIGNLDDQSGDEIEVEFDPELAPLVEAGVRYRIHPRIRLELGVTYIPLELNAAEPRLPATIAVDPLIVTVGAAWRF